MALNEILIHPLMSLFITIGSFLTAQWIQKKSGGQDLLNPIVVAIIIVVIYLVYTEVPYSEYLKNVSLIHILLGPATVALAVPLYNQLSSIKKSANAIVAAVLSACLVAVITAYYLAFYMGAAEEVQLSITSKSVTIAIAIGIAKKIGAEPSLAVFFVFTTGIIGSVVAAVIFKIVKIKNEKAIGLALGATCHGLGLARAFQYSETAGVFAAIGMSLMGIISGILLPFIIINFLI